MATHNGERGKSGSAKSAFHKFLFVSWESLSGSLAWQIKKEGHEVKIYIKEETDVYEGFLERVADWKEHADGADVIVFDDVGFGAEAERLRKAGKRVVGGTVYTDKLEEDREFGQAEMKRVGMLNLPHWDFTDYDKALKFLKENPGRYVYKPSGFVPSDYKGILFISNEEDGRDLYEIISHNKKMLEEKIKAFELQQFASGVEVGASAFFNGKDFIYPVTMGFEHKRLCTGNLGPLTGEMGTTIYWCEPNPFFNKTLALMKDDLAKAGYVGYVDINCIVNENGIYPLEFTCRFGYPFISIQMEGIISPWGEFLYAIAGGEPYDLKAKEGLQIGVVIATPPFPYEDQHEINLYHDLSIVFKKPDMQGIHPGDVKMVDGDWRIAGTVGYDLVVTGSGETMEEARKQAYERVNNVVLQNMFYRTDIGASWPEDSKKLKKWGYI